MSDQDFYPNQLHAQRQRDLTNKDTPSPTIHAAAQFVTGANMDANHDHQDAQRSGLDGQATLAQIHEATGNIERAENSRTIKESLAEAIRMQGRKEKNLRQSTISISNKDVNTKDIANYIDEEWVFKMNQAPVTFWNDKEFLHCQFINREVKQNFVASGITASPLIDKRLVAMNDHGEHFKRRPVRMIINNVRPTIKTERVIEIIKNCTDFETDITDVKSGSPHPVTKCRSIFFRTNGHGLRILIERLDGEIPYAEKDSQIKARLRARINCKPWQCKECSALGLHQCEGRKCRNCSNKGHATKDCKSITKYCGNCKKRGHKSVDLHCKTFLNEVAKEIRKMDIPVDMFEEKQLRLCLAKCIQLK